MIGPSAVPPFQGAPDTGAGVAPDDTDRHIVAIACEVAMASLDHVIAPSLADFLT